MTVLHLTRITSSVVFAHLYFLSSRCFCTFRSINEGKAAQPLWSTGKVFYFLFLLLFFFTRCMNLKYYRQSLVFKKADSYVALFEDYDERALHFNRALYVASVFISYINIYTKYITLSVTFSTSILLFNMKLMTFSFSFAALHHRQLKMYEEIIHAYTLLICIYCKYNYSVALNLEKHWIFVQIFCHFLVFNCIAHGICDTVLSSL